MIRRVKLRFSLETAVRMLRFGAPLAVGALALPILHAGDRYIIDWYRGAESLAVYYWGSRLSGLLNMLFVQSLAMAFAVVGMKALTGERVDVSLHRRAYRHYTVWAGLAVLALSLFAPEITRLLTDDIRYPSAAPLVLPLSMGYLFYGHFILFSNTLQAARRTHVIALAVVSAATLNVAMNMVLIPAIGIYGASLATVVSYFFLALLTAYLGRRDYRVRYDWLGSAVVVALVVALYVAADNLIAEPTPRLVLRLVAVLAYLPMVVVLRVYRADEIRVVWTRLRALLRRERS
jgi:O-antigen/teichoic acid export membrane protein